jgi:hypothetical protein
VEERNLNLYLALMVEQQVLKEVVEEQQVQVVVVVGEEVELELLQFLLVM